MQALGIGNAPGTSEENVVRYDVRDGIARLTLNRPAVLNAMNPEMLQALAKALDEASADPAIGVVIITGAGETAFSAGADIRYLSTATPLAVRDFARLAVAVTRRIETLGKVVIAAMNGYAFGGGLELAEACTLRIAVPAAKLSHPEVRIGAVAGFGGTTRLPRLIGKTRAMELLLTGRAIDAEEGLRIGLINRIAPANDLLHEAESLAKEIQANGAAAVRMTAEAVSRGLDLSLEESALLGADYFGLVAASEDFRVRTKAFTERNAVRFRHSG